MALLRDSEDPAADFAQVAETYSDEDRTDYPDGYTFAPDDGVMPEDFVAADFDRIENCVSTQFDAQLPGVLGKIFGGVAKGALASVPAVRARECVGCGQCAGICPAHAIGMKNRLPHIDRSVCIRCFCCQEFCPKGAMQVGRNALMRILEK